jgi:hypothetical protein
VVEDEDEKYKKVVWVADKRNWIAFIKWLEAGDSSSG